MRCLLLASISTMRSVRSISTSASHPNAAIIFCHGSGDTGPGARFYVESVAPPAKLAALAAAGIALDYPSAVPRSYRLFGGAVSSVWFDRHGGMDPRYREDTESMEASAAQLDKLVEELVAGGTAPERIALGGFSMGGGMALQFAARSERQIGAVFAMSSYLCQDSWVWTQMSTAGDRERGGNALLRSPIFMAHGDDDDFVSTQWGEDTAMRLRQGGADVQFHRVPGLGHEMNQKELGALFDFLLEKIG